MKRLVARRALKALQTLYPRALMLVRTHPNGAFLHFCAVLLPLSRQGSVLATRGRGKAGAPCYSRKWCLPCQGTE